MDSSWKVTDNVFMRYFVIALVFPALLSVLCFALVRCHPRLVRRRRAERMVPQERQSNY